ncbi:DUF1189 domain-containing protein [Bacillus salitolerans]|uniref:DUF1189 domain-containing protein n=1 Tax=Bacillus salitolerans TaxID=1437434 RepID=A0ABW4LXZ7_9BACI
MEQKTKISFFKKLGYSTTKPSLLPTMAREGAGRAILYLLLLSLTLGLISGVFQSVRASLDFNRFLQDVSDDLPHFVLENGELEIEGDEPLIFEEDPNSVFIIDDTGTYTRDNVNDLLSDYGTVTLLTKYEFISAKPFETREFRFSDLGDALYLNKQMVLDFLPVLSFLPILLGIGVVFWFFIRKLIMGLIYALVGLIVSAIFKKGYSFGTMYSMGLYAITLPTIIDILLMMIGINLTWFVYLAIVVVYFVFAMKNNDTILEEDPKTE